jgi:NAD-dependent SIR2 family protein deacetylase
MTLITQNVDDLHERAGSSYVRHLHGTLAYPYCTACLESFTFPPGVPEEPPEEPPEGRRVEPPPPPVRPLWRSHTAGRDLRGPAGIVLPAIVRRM